ncbi:phytanoyl-CoA dioxygenase family protein [Armatimonas sp.]|uniref:phytanoyl-CoA dioxygenase family protein n=1 Tax=Armatimonas sp. TaxID=1872638 RepID=UPI0037502E08
MTPNLLTAEQKAQFDRDGFLVLRNLIDPELVTRLVAAADRLSSEGIAHDGLSERKHWQKRGCLPDDPAFLELIDHPQVLPLVAGILGWDIHLMTSHLIVRPPTPGADANFKGEGWHRDGGQSSWEMTEPHPRILLKIAFFLSDQSEPGRGNTQVVPGSNRLTGPLAKATDAAHPYGAIEICGKPGDAFIFEQRTYHAVGANFSDITRKTLFIGYGFRWVFPMDFSPQHDYRELYERANPIQRQLMGDIKTITGVHLPTDADVPLRAKWREWYG